MGLAEQWEAKLKAEGLAPLDNQSIDALYPSVVKRRAEQTRRSEYDAHRTANRQRWVDGQMAAVAPALRAEFWRQASAAAQRLPHGYRCRPFLQRAAELGNVNRAARECHLTQKGGEWAWRKFLVFAGLPAPLVKGSPGRHRPTKPGQVRVEAGRYREERAA